MPDTSEFSEEQIQTYIYIRTTSLPGSGDDDNLHQYFKELVSFLLEMKNDSKASPQHSSSPLILVLAM